MSENLVQPSGEARRHPYDIITDHNLAMLKNTGRVVGGEVAERAATFLTAAAGVGFPLPLFRGTGKITKKTLGRERKRVLRWVRENKPELVETEKEFRLRLQEQFAATPAQPTKPSAE